MAIALTRRAVLLTPLAVATAADSWQNLFDGRSLDGWSPSENKASWKVVDGEPTGDGPRSHLFYTKADFKNFELEVEAKAGASCNSGIYFHTKYQEKDFPFKGFEVQINNTAGGAGTYRERKKTGSLYGLRNVYKQIGADGEWFKTNILVRGKSIQIRINGMLVVDYTEPIPAYVPPGPEKERFLDRGTFALQCHDAASKIRYRSVRVRSLPDDATGPTAAPIVDETYKTIIDHGRNNIALVDFDVQLAKPATIQNRDGFQRGIAAATGNGQLIHDDRGALKFLDSLKGQLVFAGLRPVTKHWTKRITQATAAKFDYVLADAAHWDLASLDSQAFDVYANAAVNETMLEAMARNTVALQLNERTKTPNADAIKLAKNMGVKLSFGSGYIGKGELSRCEYGVALAQECNLKWQDFWVAGAWGSTKAVDRKRW